MIDGIRAAERLLSAASCSSCDMGETTVRFLHTSDWHLGMELSRLRGEAQHRFTDSRLGALRAMGEIAASRGAEFVVVCGDVFDDNQVGPQVIGRALEVLKGIPVPVYLLPGNHDAFNAGSVYRSAGFVGGRPENVIVLDRPGIHRVRDGVEILAAPWLTKLTSRDLLAEALDAADAPATGVVRIAVGHGAVEGVVGVDSDGDVIGRARLERALSAGDVHYVALGDRHSTLSIGDSGRIRYSGSQEVTARRDPDPGNVLEVVIHGSDPEGGIEVIPHRVGTWRFLEVSADIASDADIDAWEAALIALPDKDRTTVDYTLTGSVTLGMLARLRAIEEERGLLFASMRDSGRGDLAVLPGDGEFGDLGVGGYAADAIAELETAASGGGAAAVPAADALALLYRLAGGGRR